MQFSMKTNKLQYKSLYCLDLAAKIYDIKSKIACKYSNNKSASDANDGKDDLKF